MNTRPDARSPITFRLYLFFASLLLAAALFCLYMAALPGPQKSLRFEPTVRDFGILRQGDIAIAQFILQNDRIDKAVDIVRITTDCSCTVARLPKRRLKPDEKLRFDVEFSVGTKRGDVSSRIVVESRAVGDPNIEYHELTLKAFVKPDFDYEPKQLRFSSRGRTELTVRLRSVQLATLVIKDAYCTHQAFRVTSLQSPGEGGIWTIAVSFNSDLWPETGSIAHLQIHTNSKLEPLCRIRLLLDEPSARKLTQPS